MDYGNEMIEGKWYLPLIMIFSDINNFCMQKLLCEIQEIMSYHIEVISNKK